MKKVYLVALLMMLPIISFAQLKKTVASRADLEAAQRTKYLITVDVDPQKQRYSGHQQVTFFNRNSQSTNYLLFFAYPNDPALTKSKQKYLNVTNVKVNGNSMKLEENGPFLRISLGRNLSAGQKITVDLDFEATVPVQKGSKDLFSETLDELMRVIDPKSQSESDYGIFSSGKDVLSLGMWYPVLSKYDREGWDEEHYAGIGDVSYFDPADFQVNLSAPANYQVVTTGVTVKQIPNKDKIEHQIQAQMARDFEVELSPRYQEATRLENGTTLHSYFLPEHSESGLLTMEAGLKAFQYYEKTFGAYPYTELDIVEAPLFGGAGGVEFPGLVTISSMLYKQSDPEEESDLLKQLMGNQPAFDQLLEFVVAHEVAHQWWNAVVGSNSKKHPFIDEAMANYSAVLYFENYYGREAAEQQMMMQMKVNYQVHRLIGGADRPVMQPASAFQGPLEYSAIVYGKGALYFDHLRTLMGDAAFFSAMKTYYDSFWFRIAEPGDFTRIAQKKAPAKAKEIDLLFQRWMHERHGDEDIGPGTLEAVLKTVLSTNQNLPEGQLDSLFKELDEVLNPPKN